MNKKKDVESKPKAADIEALMKDVEIRSEAVQEIMGFIPHWIIRWGITVLFFVIISIMIGSYFFKYPDIIPAQITLTTENPPADIVARTSGKIAGLFVQDSRNVRQDDSLAVIESATDYKHLFQLKEKLETLRPFLNHFENPFPPVRFSKNYVLGQLQSNFSRFSSSYDAYRRFLDKYYYRESIDTIEKQIGQNKRMQEQQKRLIGLKKEEEANGLKAYNRQKELHKNGYISESELERAYLSYLAQKNAYEDSKASLSRIQAEIIQWNQQILNLRHNRRNEEEGLQSALTQSYEDLCGAIGQWEQNYLLTAPISGIVTFTKYWSVNQNVVAGDKVMTVVPGEGGEIIGKVTLPIMGSGKVKINQKVNIKFINYPHMDYGIVSGVITSKSLVASDNAYSLEVHLPYGMLTSYNKRLEFSHEMQGTVEIITEDIRLLERIFKPIKNLLTKIDEKGELELELEQEAAAPVKE